MNNQIYKVLQDSLYEQATSNWPEVLYENPELLFANGFNEIRLEKNLNEFWRVHGNKAPYPQIVINEELVPRYVELPWGDALVSYSTLRSSSTGAWYSYVSGAKAMIENKPWKKATFRSVGGMDVINLDGVECLSNYQKYCKKTEGILTLPLLLQYSSSPSDDEPVRNTLSILTALKENYISLSDISPRELEEIVAEVLKSKGMSVFVTKKTRDGGRDVIARGELISGEPVIMAVEVKHKNVVGIQDASSFLYSNRSFPLLMLISSGRFSAGVVNEISRAENKMRVILKDGVALNQWIKEYR